MTTVNERPTNYDQVRDRIDSGKTGDKVDSPDPAAAPLGTDAEAGGQGTAPEHVARSARLETTPVRSERPSGLPGWAWAGIAVAVVIVAVLLLVAA